MLTPGRLDSIPVQSEELIDQYLGGRLSRRALVRRLIVGGASVGGAMALTEGLPAPAAATPLVGLFPELTVDLADARARKLKKVSRIPVQAFFSDELAYLKISVLRPASSGLKVVTGFTQSLNLSGPSTRVFEISFSAASYTPQAGATLILSAEAKDVENKTTYASKQVTLT
jgi:hypothetical protein